MLVQCGKILLFLVGAALCEDWPPPATVVSVLDGLRLRYNWNCNYLLRNRHDTTNLRQDLTLLIQKEASHIGIQVGAMNFSEFNLGEFLNDLRCNSDLLLVFLNEKDIKNFIVDVEQDRERPYETASMGIMLLFAEKNLFDGNFFDNVYIPFHRQFILAYMKNEEIELVEGYRIGRGWPMMTSPFGVWRKGHLTSTNKTLYDRRDDLKGFEIRASFIEDQPFSPVVTTPQGVRPDGFIRELWTVLSKQMNCSTTYLQLFPPEHTHFTMNKQLKTSTIAHMGLFTYVVTLWWSKYVEFSVPMFETSSFIYLRMPESQRTEWGKYLKPFNPRLWEMFLATVFIATVTQLVLQLCATLVGGNRSELRYQDFGQTVQLVFGAFSSQGHQSTSKSSGIRLAFLTTFLTAVVLTSAYSAKLISFLAVQHIEIPFTKPEDFIENKLYSFGFTWANSESIIFKQTLGYWGEVFNRTRRRNDTTETTLLPMTTLEGFIRACEKKYGHMGLKYDASFYDNVIPCRLITLPHFDVRVSLSLPFKKKSPYKGLVNHNLRKMRRSGILKRLVRQYWHEKRPAEEALLVHVDMRTIRPILAFLSLFVLICAMVLMMETLTNTVLRRRTSRVVRVKPFRKHTRRGKWTVY